MTEHDAFCEVVRRLESNDFDYMLTGSWAMNYWAEPRASNDIDLVVALMPSDADRFTAAFAEDFYVDLDTVRDEVGRRGMFNVIYQPLVFKFDIIVQGGDLYSRAAFGRRVRFKGAADCDTGFWVSTPEDVILSKLDWYRAGGEEDSQQFDDVVNVLVSCEDLDAAYLREWADALDLQHLFGAAAKMADSERRKLHENDA